MQLIDLLYLTVRGWALWAFIPGLSKKSTMLSGIVSALLIFEPGGTEAIGLKLPEAQGLIGVVGEFLLGLLVAIPFLVPLWAAELVGGMIEVTTGLSFASIVNPLAPGASKGLWSTVCRELTWGKMILLAILPDILTAYVESVRLAAPGSGLLPPQILATLTRSFIQAGEWTAEKGMPLLLGYLLMDFVSGLISKISTVQGANSLMQVVKCGMGAGWVYVVTR